MSERSYRDRDDERYDRDSRSARHGSYQDHDWDRDRSRRRYYDRDRDDYHDHDRDRDRDHDRDRSGDQSYRGSWGERDDRDHRHHRDAPYHRPHPADSRHAPRQPYPAQPPHSERSNHGRSHTNPATEESPPPDEDVLAFIRSQQETSGSSKLDKEAEKLKMERFQHGASNKKSKYLKEKEQAEKKRKREEEEAAQAYQEFVKAMQGDDSSTANKPIPKGFVASGGKSQYQASRPLSAGSASKPVRPTVADFDDQDDPDDSVESTKPRKDPTGKKKGAMEDFLGELQRNQAAREERLRSRVGQGNSISSLIALEGQKVGSRDVGDPLTTNVCILNLPANVSEDDMGEYFSQWGDVAMVKIMWPRGEEFSASIRRERSAGLTGFVAFMTRRDAEFCSREADGISWNGSTIKTSWGKAMALPPRPRYPMTISSRSRKPRRGSPSAPMDASGIALAEKVPRLIIRHRSRQNAPRSPSPRARIRASIEKKDARVQPLIELVAARILEHGPMFEQVIREKEKDNPKFAFLQDESSEEHEYFRMCLDNKYCPAAASQPFRDEGYDSLYSTDTGEESETDRMRTARRTDTIGPVARKRLEAMLRGLTPRRERIARLMAFAIDHAFAADAVAEIICQSVMIPSTPIPRKIARLHTISDILHNSAAPVPNAWKYRQAFETRLPQVFEHLGQVLVSFPGRIKAEGFRMQVMSVIDCWENWLVLSPMSLEKLVQALNSGSKAGTSNSDLAEPEQVATEADEDLDGEAIEDGNVAKDVAPNAEDVDGEAMDMGTDEEEEDLDGEAL